MAQNYTITELAGLKGNLRVATTDTATADERSVKSPEWMIKIDDLLSSNVKDYTDHAELFGWYGESSRLTTSDISGSLFTSASLKHTDLVLIVNNGGHGAQLESKMNLGIPLKTVEIIRLGNIKQVKVKLQTLEFGTCRVQSFQQQLDRLVLFLNISSKTNTVYVYDQDGGSKGQMVSKADYSQNTAE